MKDGAGASKHLVLLSDYPAMHTLTKGIFHDNLLLQSIQDCIRAVVEEEGFHLPSEEAEAALNFAKSLSKWFEGEQSRKAVEEFNNKLETSLKECIQNAVQQGSSVDAQCLWSSYQKLIVSPAFRANWEGFFQDGECASKCTGVSVCYTKTDGLFSEETASYSRSQHKFTSSRAHLH